MQGDVALVHVKEPGLEVTVYSVIALPLAPAPDHETDTSVSPRVPVTVVGGVGKPAGVTPLDAAEATEFPTMLVATTVNV